MAKEYTLGTQRFVEVSPGEFIEAGSVGAPAPAAPVAPTDAAARPEAKYSTGTPSAAETSGADAFWMGLKKSGLDTVQGVEQLYNFAAGSPEQQAAVDQAIKDADARYGPSMDTMSGKLGYVLGTIGQFAAPSGVVGAVGRIAPKAIQAFPKVAAFAKELIAPTTVTRSAGSGAAFEATRPTEGGSENLLRERATRGALGAVGAGVGTGAGKLIGAYARPLTGAQKEVAEEVTGLAKEVGSPPLLLGQIRQEPMVRILEEGAAITPGAAGPVRNVVRPQRDFLQKTAAETLGAPGERPTGMAIEDAWKAAIQRGYAPIEKGIVELKPTGIETRYFKRLGSDAMKNYATPQGQAAAKTVAKDVLTPGTGFNGSRVVRRLQSFRDLLADPNIDVVAKDEIRLIQKDFEDWAKRAAIRKYGPPAQGWFDDLDVARQELSGIHKIREATDPATGEFSPAKFARADVKGSPRKAGGTRTGDLGQLAKVSRLAQLTKSPIGSSGTTERWMGSRILNALATPAGTVGAAALGGAALGDTLEEQAGYGAGLLLGSRGIGKALTADILRRNAIKGFPKLNWMAERLGLPTVAAGEAISQ